MQIDESSTTGGHITDGVQPTADSSLPPKEKKDTKEELTPRQISFLRFYNDPNSETFSNAYQSAIKAGFSDEYAKNITGQMPDWLSENIRKKKRLLAKAEKALEESLDMPVEVVKYEQVGFEEGQRIFDDVVKTEPALVKIKQDTAKFIAETVGKDEGYSKRTEMTGKNGQDLIPKPLLANVRDNNSTTEDNSSNKED